MFIPTSPLEVWLYAWGNWDRDGWGFISGLLIPEPPCVFLEVIMVTERKKKNVPKTTKSNYDPFLPSLNGLNCSVCQGHLDPVWKGKTVYQEQKNFKKRRRKNKTQPSWGEFPQGMKAFRTHCDSEAQSWHSLAVNQFLESQVGAILLVATTTLYLLHVKY